MSQLLSSAAEAAEYLRRGELVAIPTETVYGLAANGLDARAVARIFTAKQRPSFDPLILHLSHPDQVYAQVVKVPEVARALWRHFSPGPLTLVLKKKAKVPDIVTAGMNSVAVRIPRHPLCMELLQQLDFPLAAPSANVFGQTSPTRPEHVEEQLGHAVPWILDGGACAVGVESTIVDVRTERPVILRHGGVSQEAIEAVLGFEVKTQLSSSRPTAPGMLVAHYSPGLPVQLIEEGAALPDTGSKKVGFLGFRLYREELPEEQQFILSKSGNAEEAATHLFHALRQLKTAGAERIVAERLPDIGLGRAINDRLMRAAQS